MTKAVFSRLGSLGGHPMVFVFIIDFVFVFVLGFVFVFISVLVFVLFFEKVRMTKAVFSSLGSLRGHLMGPLVMYNVALASKRRMYVKSLKFRVFFFLFLFHSFVLFSYLKDPDQKFGSDCSRRIPWILHLQKIWKIKHSDLP